MVFIGIVFRCGVDLLPVCLWEKWCGDGHVKNEGPVPVGFLEFIVHNLDLCTMRMAPGLYNRGLNDLQSLAVGCVDIPATGQQDDKESLQQCCSLMHIYDTVWWNSCCISWWGISWWISSCILSQLVVQLGESYCIAVQPIAGWLRCMFGGLLHVDLHSGKQLCTNTHKINKTKCSMNTSTTCCFFNGLNMDDHIDITSLTFKLNKLILNNARILSKKHRSTHVFWGMTSFSNGALVFDS